MDTSQICHTRSTSMPCSTHPAAFEAEEQLHKVRGSVAFSSPGIQTMCNGLHMLEGLLHSIQKLLLLPSNQQSFLRPRKWVEVELEASVMVLDLCGALRDSFSHAQEQIRDLQLTLRKGDKNIVAKINSYISTLKKMQKEINGHCKSFGQKDRKPAPVSSYEDELARIVVETRDVIISVLQQTASFLAMPCTTPKTSRWSAVTKALNKRKIISIDENVDTSSCSVAELSFCIANCGSAADLQKAQSQLKTLEISFSNVQTGLEALFRGLIQIRVSLLNISSLHS